jgi:DNA-binding PadR family transcriptional regulator
MAALRVLQAVSGGAEYGFDIIDATGLPSGTVYPALSRHERDGYVRSSWEDPRKAHQEGRPQRRYYRITAEGRRALQGLLATLGSGVARRPRAARARS